MPDIINYKEVFVDMNGISVKVVTPVSFKREWEVGQLWLECLEVGCTNLSCHGHKTTALVYKTSDVKIYIHPTVVTNDGLVSFDTSGDNAVTVEEWEYTMWEKKIVSLRLANKKMSSVDDILELTIGELAKADKADDDALEWWEELALGELAKTDKADDDALEWA